MNVAEDTTKEDLNRHRFYCPSLFLELWQIAINYGNSRCFSQEKKINFEELKRLSAQTTFHTTSNKFNSLIDDPPLPHHQSNNIQAR